MRGFWKLAWVELKLYLREPFASFFTLVFPLMMLFLFGSIYGNKPTPFFAGRGFVDVMVPAYTAMIIGTTGLMSLSISIAAYREQGVLKRYRSTPVSPLAVVGAQVATLFLVTLLGMLLLLAAGSLIYKLHMPARPLAVLAGFILGCLALFALGFVLAGIMPTARSAQITAMVIFYPMIFLTGATIPREVMPASIQGVARFLPLDPVVKVLQGMWRGDAWAGHIGHVLFLAGLAVAGTVVAVKTFRWE